LDNDENCPAGKLPRIILKETIWILILFINSAKLVDVLTFEIENVNIEALKKLKSEGHRIVPDPEILELIQDKGLQKEFYEKNGIPTSGFKIYESETAVLMAIEKGEIHFPFVQKLRKGGYDGRGVAVINDKSDLKNYFQGHQ
jgi:5-(carboxyamino)imidazole ribonucleotide synthase